MHSPILTVVLATYNGARFLPEQLFSLSAQSRRPDRLVLRDDGSRVVSVDIVRAWTDREGIDLQLVEGDRLGPARSFLVAVQAAHSADLFLFCDQDDVWFPDKIERALALVPHGDDAAPVLYATRLDIADEHLHSLRLSSIPKNLSFESAAFESVLTGCRMAFNAAFRTRLIQGVPSHIGMHDWWCYLLATATNGAALHFDPKPSVNYRQHSSNTLGAGPTGWRALYERVRRFMRGDSTLRSRQLHEFEGLHVKVLSPHAATILHQLLGAKSALLPRLTVAFTVPIHRQTWRANLTTRLALLTNRF